MSRRRLLVAAVGAGVVLAALPALADVEPGRTGRTAAEVEALQLLARAAEAGRRLSYSGTQYVASWRDDAAAASLVELEHDPVRGSVVTGGDARAETTQALAVLDRRMLDRLAAGYALAVTGPGRCTGRAATVVEARRADGSVAGRFWVDRATGMLLRREVFDGEGTRVRSSAFVDLAVDEAPAAALRLSADGAAPDPQRPDTGALRRDGWHVPRQLPEGFALFDTELRGEVLQLAYTDGLSTLSLFAQDGELGTGGMSGFEREEVDGRPVWVRGAAPERVVWAGGDHVWTLVSDAPEAAVRAAVAALPHDPEPDDGVGARLGRGLSRLGRMLNPFD